MDCLMGIGELAAKSGVSASTLRYYEEIGLVVPDARERGQRRYSDAAFGRLRIVALCKAAGFSLAEIASLFNDRRPGRPESRKLAEVKLVQLDAQMLLLTHARAIVEWGMRCTCPSLDACKCDAHRDLAFLEGVGGL